MPVIATELSEKHEERRGVKENILYNGSGAISAPTEVADIAKTETLQKGLSAVEVKMDSTTPSTPDTTEDKRSGSATCGSIVEDIIEENFHSDSPRRGYILS